MKRVKLGYRTEAVSLDTEDSVIGGIAREDLSLLRQEAMRSLPGRVTLDEVIDFSAIQVEAGIEIPPKEKRMRGLTALLKRMGEGESAFIPCPTVMTLDRLQGYISARSSVLGVWITSRRVTEAGQAGVRVWNKGKREEGKKEEGKEEMV